MAPRLKGKVALVAGGRAGPGAGSRSSSARVDLSPSCFATLSKTTRQN
jgi:hypothetical protein